MTVRTEFCKECGLYPPIIIADATTIGIKHEFIEKRARSNVVKDTPCYASFNLFPNQKSRRLVRAIAEGKELHFRTVEIQPLSVAQCVVEMMNEKDATVKETQRSFIQEISSSGNAMAILPVNEKETKEGFQSLAVGVDIFNQDQHKNVVQSMMQHAPVMTRILQQFKGNIFLSELSTHLKSKIINQTYQARFFGETRHFIELI